MTRDEWFHLALVLVTIWVSMGLWFAGIALRLLNKQALFDCCWLVGAIMLVIHVIASYGIVHHWSHAAALEATRQESIAVTGIAAAWGVYLNFAFAISWLGYVLLRFARIKVRRLIEGFALTFQTLIVLSATVVFESGPVRWFSLAAFAVLAILAYSVRRKSIQNKSSDG